MPTGGQNKSKLSMRKPEIQPYAVAALEKYSSNALTVGEVLRLVEKFALEEHGDRALYPNSQMVAFTLTDMVSVANATVYRRRADENLDGPLYAVGGGSHSPWLYSVTHPVPAWSPTLHEEIWALPAARQNPELQPTGRRSRATPKPRTFESPIDLGKLPASSERAELIISLVRELVRDAETVIAHQTTDDSVTDALRKEVNKLTADRDRYREERDEATKKLRTIATAQKRMAEALGIAAPVADG